MRLLYFSHVNVRSQRGHVHNTLKTCEALQMAGMEVTWVNPDVRPSEMEEILKAHDVQTSFRQVFLGTVSADEQNQPSRVKRLWAIVRMQGGLIRYAWSRRAEFDIVYYRYHLLVVPALFAKWILRKTVIFESHYVYIAKPVAQAITGAAVHTAHGVVAITNALRHAYGLSDARSIMAPCHAVESRTVPHTGVTELRYMLGLPEKATILCYTGSLGATIQGISYEVETMVEILPSLPASCVSLIVGAREDRPDGEALQGLAERLGVTDRVMIRPWCDRETLMRYLVASDVLVMPRVGTAPGSSPSKMFDYLAVGKPIVAATTPPVAEILTDGENALLVNADVPQEWAVAVRRLLDDAALRERIAEGASRDGEQYTWESRGRRIAAFIKQMYAPAV